jgi:murein DD-endopeptidase MepM/ murein hydrolase activator NlpD
MALASGAVGLLSSPAEGGAVDASRVGMRLPGPAHSDTVAQAVAESRQQRVSRSMQRYAQLRSEAQAAIALDKRIDAMEQEMAAEQAAAEKRAAAAREAARPKWVLPVLHFHLTAGFGESSGLWAHRHTGQDFAAPTGTPIRAVGDGRIVFAGWDGPYGRKIIVRHSDGTETWYCHMSAFLRTGGTVKAGQVIGRVGSTGNTTGPHLHLEVRPGGGAPINPLPWLRAHGVKV